jgi:hypothetical protein
MFTECYFGRKLEIIVLVRDPFRESTIFLVDLWEGNGVEGKIMYRIYELLYALFLVICGFIIGYFGK